MAPSYGLREDDTYPANTLVLESQPSELWEINFCCLGCPSHCILHVSLSWQGQGPWENVCVCEPGMVRGNLSVAVFTLRPLRSFTSQLMAARGGPTSTSCLTQIMTHKGADWILLSPSSVPVIYLGSPYWDWFLIFFAFKIMGTQMVKKNSPFSHMGNSDKVLDSLKSSSEQWGLGGEE